MGQRKLTQSNTRTAGCTSLALALVACLLSSTAAAESGQEVSKWREGTRYSLGLGLLMGELDFRSNPVVVIADIGQLPSFAAGVQAWISENAGFDASYQLGTFGTLEVPLDVLIGREDPNLKLTHHRFSGAFNYRLFTGPRLTSWGVGLRLGFILHSLVPSPHTPTIVLSTQYFGPELGVTLRAPLSPDIGVDLEAAGLFPFSVREFPDRSGSPKTPIGAHIGAAPYVRLNPKLNMKLRYDMRHFNIGFDDEGNRGLGGVTGGATNDTFHSLMLELEFIP